MNHSKSKIYFFLVIFVYLFTFFKYKLLFIFKIIVFGKKFVLNNY